MVKQKISPAPGWIVIEPPQDDFFTMPQEQAKNHRVGKVIATGGNIIHASGKILPSPVKVGDIVSFQYVENHDLELQGKKYYVVQFNLITGVIHGSE